MILFRQGQFTFVRKQGFPILAMLPRPQILRETCDGGARPARSAITCFSWGGVSLRRYFCQNWKALGEGMRTIDMPVIARYPDVS